MEGYLYMSLLWGTVGSGCIIYGKKQGEWTPALTGVALIVVATVVTAPLPMSLLSIALLFAMRFLMRRGW